MTAQQRAPVQLPRCLCVADHQPEPQSLDRHHIWPLGMEGPDTPGNIVVICPTTHRNVHELLRAWVAWQGQPPWEIRRHFSPYARQLAHQGYHAAQAAALG
jgi:hypothetical protein